MAGSAWVRGGAVAVSALAFACVVVQAQGGCGTEPAPSASEAAGAQADPESAPDPKPVVPAQATPTPLSAPPAAPVNETPKGEPGEAGVKKEMPVFLPASKSGGFDFPDARSGAGIGTIDPPKATPGDKSNNAGNKKTKPKAFFPASKSGRVREPPPPQQQQQAPNPPATK